MSLTVSEGAGSFELAPEGTHVARCYRIIDLGTQTSVIEGEQKSQKKVLLQWELLGDSLMQDGKPFNISRRFTASLHERADLRKVLESWRGKAFTDDELKAFQLSKVLGAYCLMQVVHTQKGGRDFANPQTIMSLPKGTPKPPGVNDLVLLDFDAFDWQVFDSLHDKLRETVAAAPEFKELQAARNGSAAKPKDPGQIDDDDIEF